MDREQLNLKLQAFKNACLEEGYIKGDFYFDEAEGDLIQQPLRKEAA